MTDDSDGGTIRRMPNDQLRELVSLVAEALRNDPAPDIIPPPDTRSFTGTGVDALVFGRVKEEITRDILRRIERESERFREDIRRDINDAVRGATRDFLSEEEIDRRIEQRFDDIGLPVDREHKQETSESVRSWRRWQKRIDKVLGGMALALVTAVLYALARMVGVNLPVPGSEH